MRAASEGTVFIPIHLEHQTHCFKHKKKLEIFNDHLVGEPYLECPICREEMFMDVERFFRRK